MSRRIKDTKTISFLWKPETYKLRWAEEPDEVPYSDMPPGQDLGSNPLTSLGVRDVPKRSCDYPKLVRSNPEQEPVSGQRDLSNEDVINDIGQLASEEWLSGKQSKRLKNKIHYLSEKYGPPHRFEDNTLNAWLNLAVRVRTELTALQKLQKRGVDAAIPWFFELANNLTKQSTREHDPLPNYIHIKGIYDPIRPKELSSNKLNILSTQAATELKTLTGLIEGAERLELSQSGEYRTEQFRIIIFNKSRANFNSALAKFPSQSFSGRISFEPGGVSLSCNLDVWLEYKLAELWRGNSEVLNCPVCGTLFVPTRRNMRYCRRGTCADKKYRDSDQQVKS